MSRQAGFSRFVSSLPLASGLLALALAGCNQTTAQQSAPARPVLVTSAHYEAQITDRLSDAFYLRASVTCGGKLAVRFEFTCTLAAAV